MDIAPLSGGDTRLEMALRVAVQIVQQKVAVNDSTLPSVCYMVFIPALTQP